MKHLFVVLLVIMLVLTGCGGKKDATKIKSAVPFNKTGLPIVNEKITLKALVCRPSHFGKWSEMKFYKDLETKTGIHIEWQELLEPYQEKINLMFASQDYPDIMFRGATDTQILTAAQTGNVIALNDLIEQWAPNWKKVIDDDPYIKKSITMTGGNIYGLPFVRMDEADYGIRDLWFINNDWLKKLNLSVPQTTEEFYNVLKRFKSAAGKELPSNAIPWAMRYNQNVGGHFDIFSSFGIIESSNHIMVKDSKVLFTATMPEAKEAIKYLHRLYSEGLIPQESFTDDWAAYLSKIKSTPSIVGSFGAYNHPFEDESVFVPMLAPKAEGVAKSLMRKQTTMIIRNSAVIFRNNKYPEVTMRWLDELATDDNSIQLLYGTFGDTIEKNGDNYQFIQKENIPDASQFVSGNFGPAAVTKDIISKVKYTGLEAVRRKYYFDLYKENTVSIDTMYPNVVFTQEQADMRSQYGTDVNNYVQETFADFIVNGNIDAKWDAYVAKLNSLGLEKLMDIYQKALDEFNSN